MHTKHHWIVAADSRGAELYSLAREPGGHAQATHLDSLKSSHENEHEHHRPSMLGKGPTSNAAQHFAAWGHEDAEEVRRFAKEVAVWLGSAHPAVKPAQTTLFVASRFLGILKQALDADWQHATLREAELTNLSAAELGQRADVASILENPAHA